MEKGRNEQLYKKLDILWTKMSSSAADAGGAGRKGEKEKREFDEQDNDKTAATNLNNTKTIFSSINNLYSLAKKTLGPNETLTRKDVVNFLRGKDTYTRFKQYRSVFPRRMIDAGPELHNLWSLDVALFMGLGRWNFGYKYVLLVTEWLGGFIWTQQLKHRTGEEIVSALKIILERAYPNKPKKIWGDRESAFYSSTMQTFLKENSISIYATHGQPKSAQAERKIQMLKNRLYLLMNETDSWRWVTSLQKITDSCNNTRNRMTGKAAVDVNEENAASVYEYRRKQMLKKGNFLQKFSKKDFYSFEEGNVVRVAINQGDPFRRGFEPSISSILYKISKRLPTFPHTYELKLMKSPEDEKNNPEDEGVLIAKTWYSPELSKVEFYDSLDKIFPTKEKRIPKWKPRKL